MLECLEWPDYEQSIHATCLTIGIQELGLWTFTYSFHLQWASTSTFHYD
jgi:hypothetical protein